VAFNGPIVNNLSVKFDTSFLLTCGGYESSTCTNLSSVTLCKTLFLSSCNSEFQFICNRLFGFNHTSIKKLDKSPI